MRTVIVIKKQNIRTVEGRRVQERNVDAAPQVQNRAMERNIKQKAVYISAYIFCLICPPTDIKWEPRPWYYSLERLVDISTAVSNWDFCIIWKQENTESGICVSNANNY